jgi:hypothetical protein
VVRGPIVRIFKGTIFPRFSTFSPKIFFWREGGGAGRRHGVFSHMGKTLLFLKLGVELTVCLLPPPTFSRFTKRMLAPTWVVGGILTKYFSKKTPRNLLILAYKQ